MARIGDQTIYTNSQPEKRRRRKRNSYGSAKKHGQNRRSIGDQSIYANIISLDFSKNLIEIQEEVYFKNKNAKIKADKIELNFENKKLKISMDKQDDKVEIVSKY